MGTRHAALFDVWTGRPWKGKVEDVWFAGPKETDLWLVGPALFDPQVNGFGGVDFQSPNLTGEEFEQAVREIHRAGCSHFLPTLITAPEDFLVDRLSQLAEWVDSSPFLSRSIPGFHLEGPFLSTEPGYPGAHPTEHLRHPDPDLFDRFFKASKGRLKAATIAPELPGAIDLIRRLRPQGVRVCLGHTNADLGTCIEAIEAGAVLATHLGNGCPETLHRHDNIVQRLLSLPDLLVSIVPDGFHVPAPAIENLVSTVGPARLVFTTDAVSAAGAPPGNYTLGPLRLEVGADGMVRHPNGKSFAGSGLRMIDGLQNAVRFGGIGYGTAWRAWTRFRTRFFPGCAVPFLAVPFAGALPVEFRVGGDSK